jgi:hypothetical protein
MSPLRSKQPWVVVVFCATSVVSGCKIIRDVGASLQSKGSQTKASEVASRAAQFVRVEDLPPVGFVRVDDLAPAPPIAVRPLQGRELTPALIRRAEDLIRKEEAPLGTQVVVESGDRRYIARFEWHYHDELSGERPQGWHKGVTLYSTE